ncbi:MAG: GntR family transcriptional regulator [Streptomycetales bacterium]
MSDPGNDGRRGGAAGKNEALAALRYSVLQGDKVPGQRLVEAELADDLGVTRTSVREALIELAADGLVERVPNRGARVRIISVEEAVEITECRMALEGLCAARAAERVTRAQTDRLSEIGAQMRDAVADGDPLRYSELNQQLHRFLICEVAGQRVAAGLIDRLHGQIVRHQFRLALRRGRPDESLSEHLAIIEAIVARNPPAAEQAARRHLLSIIAALRPSENAGSHSPSVPAGQAFQERQW